MYTWVKGNLTTPQVTIYPNNLTLNSAAASYFEDIRWVKLGYSLKKNQIAIKPITKNELDLGLVDQEDLHKLSYGKGYARITNKYFIDNIVQEFKIEATNNKYNANFDSELGILIVQL